MHHYQATKSLRSLAAIGGVSTRTLEAQLAWIKKHPEAPTRFAIHTFATRRSLPRVGCATPPPASTRIVYQVLDANHTHQRISASMLQPFCTVLGDCNVEAADGHTEDWTIIDLGKTLQHLCDGSDAFTSLLRDMAEKSGMPHASRQRICMTARGHHRPSASRILAFF